MQTLCHYCEESFNAGEEVSTTKNGKKFHYPYCYVKFTTFYLTKKQFEAKFPKIKLSEK